MLKKLIIIAALATSVSTVAVAQVRVTTGLTLEGAKNIVAAAEAEAKKNGWSMSIAVVDAAGELVFFEKSDMSGPVNADFAMRKARTAARYRRPTNALDSSVTAGRLQYLATDALPIGGGVPIVVRGQAIGAVAASGGTAAQDAQVASAGVAALNTTTP
jgi:Uncharacterized protein, possibly involved in utilization of glycolate and propanediol